MDQNVDRLFFGLEAPLMDEFEQLYASLFKNPTAHIAVVMIKRADHSVNLCEMKFAEGEYEIKAEEDLKIMQRREAFIEDEGFKGSVFVTMVTPHGVLKNGYWNNIQSEVTLDGLFREA